jgi:hypothetical protein
VDISQDSGRYCRKIRRLAELRGLNPQNPPTEDLPKKAGNMTNAWCLRTGAGQIIPYQTFFVKHFC